MKFQTLDFEGAFLIDIDKREDERGWFGRLFCENIFKEKGLDFQIKQINSSLSKNTGTLRGLHFQKQPYEETKIIKVISGKIYDLILDLRPMSKTYLKWKAFELDSINKQMLLVPRGFAHSILTLQENTEILYFVDQFYTPDSESGIRWNDPFFKFEWPIEPTNVSVKDQNWPSFKI